MLCILQFFNEMNCYHGKGITYCCGEPPPGASPLATRRVRASVYEGTSPLFRSFQTAIRVNLKLDMLHVLYEQAKLTSIILLGSVIPA
jgi:hypothetical protein